MDRCTDRRDAVIELVSRFLEDAACEVLGVRISQHYSQLDWEGFTDEIVANLARRLAEDPWMKALCEAGDTKRGDGTINVPAVYRAMSDLCDQHPNNDRKGPVLRYLLNHMRTALMSTNLLKESDAPRRSD